MGNKLKPFDLEKALAGDPVVTGLKEKVYSLTYSEYVSEESSVITCVVNGEWRTYSKLGRFYSNRECFHSDLFMAPVKKEGWVNLYNFNGEVKTGQSVFDTEKLAKSCAHGGSIATIKIEWEE